MVVEARHGGGLLAYGAEGWWLEGCGALPTDLLCNSWQPPSLSPPGVDLGLLQIIVVSFEPLKVLSQATRGQMPGPAVPHVAS